MKKNKLFTITGLLILLAIAVACRPMLQITPATIPTAAEREASIHAGAIKMLPETDENPPLMLSDEFEAPVPVPGLVNTAGAEDSVFVAPDGKTIYFFFTPDVNVPAEKQLLDGVTGLYVSHWMDSAWGRPERILLQERGRPALDGCGFVQENVMWFCSAREGYEGPHWFTALHSDGRWRDWTDAGFDPAHQVGELHISPDGHELYFHSARPGGKGGMDIWISRLVDGAWGEPENLAAVNTPADEGWPALNPAGDELWITRNWGVWRSTRAGGEWQEAELIVSPLAGEASLDAAGNLYFVHHYYAGGRMIEADIYVARRKN